MCGIAGTFCVNSEKRSKTELRTMCDAIAHRGPDSDDYFYHKGTSLGHRRLSILDLSENGRQPMSYRNYTIVFNGEIYNHQDLRDKLGSKHIFRSSSDTETILHCYAEYGEKFVSLLRGMFSFAIYDMKENLIFCSRDRYGIKPFYFAQLPNLFAFCSEIKGLLTLSGVDRKVNETALYDFLVFNRSDHLEETMFSGIHRLLPGESITISKDGVKRTTWFRPKKLQESNRSASKLILDFRETLIDSVRSHLQSDVPVSVALSGGIDSSSIASIVREVVGKNEQIHSFSAVYNPKWEKDERAFIMAVARAKKLTTHFAYPRGPELFNELRKLVYHQEEPFHSSSIFAGWKVMEKVQSQGIKVILNGQGADEILGYDYMAAFYFVELFRSGRYWRMVKEIAAFSFRQKFGVHFTLQLYIFLFMPKFLRRKLVGARSSWLNNDWLRKSSRKSQFAELFFSARSLNESVVLHLRHKLAHLLRVEDRNSMAFSVESRVPFLDNQLVDYSLKVPAALKIHSGQLKYILRQSIKDLLPIKIYQRKSKIGFETPQAEWFREKKAYQYLKRLFHSPSFQSRPYFNHQKIIQLLEQHYRGNRDHSEKLWKALFVELWFQIFIDSDQVSL